MKSAPASVLSYRRGNKSGRARAAQPNGVADVLSWVYAQPRYFPFTSDLMIWPIGLVAGATLKLVLNVRVAADELLVAIVVAVAVHSVLGFATGLYRGRWRISSFNEMSTPGNGVGRYLHRAGCRSILRPLVW